MSIVKTEFETKDAYVEEGIPTFIIDSTPHLNEKIENLRSKLKLRGYEIVLRQSEAGIKLLVFAMALKPYQPRKIFGFSYPRLLLIATIISVTVSGFLTTSDYLNILKILNKKVGDESLFLLSQTVLYTLSIMCIVGLHEVGHTLACIKNHVEASTPIFIPGIPGVTPGTFGAVITQRDPILNRDQLFDIGLSGPLVGFVISLVISYFGYSMSLPLSKAELQLVASISGPPQFVNLPLIFRLFGSSLLRSSRDFTLLFSPLAIAGWIGTLITFLNAFPIGQLDGGHVARAVLSSKQHRTLSYIMTAVMFLTGWWMMALFVTLLMRFDHPGTLDDISHLSRNRMILALLLIVIFLSTFTISPDSLLSLFL